MDSTNKFKSRMGMIRVQWCDQVHSSELIAVSDDGKLWRYTICLDGQTHVSERSFGSAENALIIEFAQQHLLKLVSAAETTGAVASNSAADVSSGESPHLVA